MTPPDQTPKLPKWIFFLTDAVLLLAAWFIADNSARPLSGHVILAILACVIVGALVATVPLIAHYERVKNEALDERQRALESLSRTVAASAEQIGIAANGLHEIAELAQRNLKAAEQLPAKLQEKIAGLKNPADGSRDPEREELKKELTRLRAADSERLQSATGQLTRAVTELTRLAALRPEAPERLRPEPVTAVRPEPSPATSPEPAEAPQPEPVVNIVSVVEALSSPPSVPEPVSAAAPETAPPPARRIRKPRPETATVSPAPATPVVEVDEPPPIPAAAIPEVVPVAPDSAPPFETSLADVSAPASPIVETPSPKPERKRAPRRPKAEEPVEVSGAESSLPLLPHPSPDEPTLGLAEAATNSEPGAPAPMEPGEPVSPEPAEPPATEVERAVSSDGATRLLVTAYIGIGNRLFIRGAGPGLRWEKGLPLQFVSIGKWRWETADAAAPVQFKLYKNDDIECAALGTQTLDPGQQGEVTATF